jgi:prephenate dehydratase
MPCRGIRGATTADENSPVAILAATTELLHALIAANSLLPEEVASATFTVTPDLDAAFPAQAARALGWTTVPLLDAVEIGVPGALPRCIRVLIHWNTDLPSYAVRHVYLRDAVRLRPDLADESQIANRKSQMADGKWQMANRKSQMGNGNQELAGVTNGSRSTQHAAREVQLPASSFQLPVVAFQGEPGAYSQEAIFQHFGAGVETVACPSFEDIFTAVEAGQTGYGLLPVENSQAGSITQAYDLLLERDLRVVGEVKFRVRHCLLAPSGTAVADIRCVRSHPQALAQCERYLKTRGWQAIPAYDTAGAAAELAAHPEPEVAAIASALAGRTYGLAVLDAGIEDSPDNTTRFFVLGRQELPPGKRNKTSIVFATLHQPGALHSALGELASRGINLTKIESRPRRNRPWHYVFYVDLEGHWQDANVHRALSSLLARTAFIKLLGSYPAAEDEGRQGNK